MNEIAQKTAVPLKYVLGMDENLSCSHFNSLTPTLKEMFEKYIESRETFGEKDKRTKKLKEQFDEMRLLLGDFNYRGDIFYNMKSSKMYFYDGRNFLEINT